MEPSSLETTCSVRMPKSPLIKISIVSLLVTALGWLITQIVVLQTFFPPIGTVGVIGSIVSVIFLNMNRKWTPIPSVVWNLFVIVTEIPMVSVHLADPLWLDSIIAFISWPLTLVSLGCAIGLLIQNYRH